jgi:Transposase IS4
MDARRTIGSVIEAKACHVTSLAECARRYGAQKSTKFVEGVVVDVENIRNLETSRTKTMITADYSLGGGVVKRVKLNIRSIRTVAVVEEGAGADLETNNNIDSPDGEIVQNAQDPINNDIQMNENDNINDLLDPGINIQQQQDTVDENVMQLPNNNIGLVVNNDEIPAINARITLPAINQPVCSPHGYNWYEDDQASVSDINGTYNTREWGLKTPIGDVLRMECNVNKRLSRLDVFYLMFPPSQLDVMVRCTNNVMREKNKKTTTKGEMIKFLGVIVLMTRYEFKSRASLWATTAISKYETAPCFGRTNMSRVRFDDIWTCLRWSEQPSDRTDGMSSERYRWLLVDGFVDRFNVHRAKTFVPSEHICVDESISRWYGQGGEWINHGLPMYIAIDRKPENGCEIQNAACAKSGVMLRLRLVKTAEEEATHTMEGADGLLHGTKILKYLILPWQFSDRMVCADSYFASVGAAEEFRRMRMRFIGVVKTATKQYPMAYLSNIELHERSDRRWVVARDPDGTPRLLAFVWMDRNRRYFIASGSSLLVDCWRVYSKLSFNKVNKIEVQKDFYAHLAAEMIDNNFDRVAPAVGRSPSSIDDDDKGDLFCRTTMRSISTFNSNQSKKEDTRRKEIKL